MVGIESFTRADSPLSKHDQLTKAAELYREIDDTEGTARSAMVLFLAEYANAAAFEGAQEAAERSGKAAIRAVLFQFDANKKMAAKAYGVAQKSAQTCRDLYLSIKALEQVTHCDVVLAELAKAQRQSCGH